METAKSDEEPQKSNLMVENKAPSASDKYYESISKLVQPDNIMNPYTCTTAYDPHDIYPVMPTNRKQETTQEEIIESDIHLENQLSVSALRRLSQV